MSRENPKSPKIAPKTLPKIAPKAAPKAAPKPVTKTSPLAGTITAVIDDNFPSVEAVASPHSDALIFPLEARPSENSLRIVRGMEFSDKAPDSVGETETLIWALTQSNAFNSGWVGCELDHADGRRSRTARLCSQMSPR
jgi:hypothetical protein